MKKPKEQDKHSLWLDSVTSQVKEGGLDIRTALSLAFYSGELVGAKANFPVDEEKI